MEQYKAILLKGTILAVIALFAVKLLHPFTGKYFTWGGAFGGYVESFLILFATLLLADWIIKKVWAV